MNLNLNRGPEEYLRYDPFEGDRDVDVRCRTVRLVKTRKPQRCLDPFSHNHHEIPPGTTARYEKALIDGSFWGRYYVCVECMEKWLKFVEGGTDVAEDS